MNLYGIIVFVRITALTLIIKIIGGIMSVWIETVWSERTPAMHQTMLSVWPALKASIFPEIFACLALRAQVVTDTPYNAQTVIFMTDQNVKDAIHRARRAREQETPNAPLVIPATV